MRKIIVVVIVGLILSQHTLAIDNDKPPEVMEQTILRLLFTPVYDAIKDYYGEPRQYWQDKLLSIQKVPNGPYYEAVMQVETFFGPHNPPYGLETLTFYISYGKVELKSFIHADA